MIFQELGITIFKRFCDKILVGYIFTSFEYCEMFLDESEELLKLLLINLLIASKRNHFLFQLHSIMMPMLFELFFPTHPNATCKKSCKSFCQTPSARSKLGVDFTFT